MKLGTTKLFESAHSPPPPRPFSSIDKVLDWTQKDFNISRVISQLRAPQANPHMTAVIRLEQLTLSPIILPTNDDPGAISSGKQCMYIPSTKSLHRQPFHSIVLFKGGSNQHRKFAPARFGHLSHLHYQ